MVTFDPEETVGQRIRKARNAKRLSQKELADMCAVNWRTISGIEGDVYQGMQTRVLKPLCEVLGISADALLDIHVPTPADTEALVGAH